MSEKYRKLITNVRIEMAEAEVADKEGVIVRARACLLRAKRLLDGFLRKAYKNEKDSTVDSS